jgi:predicted RNase H-like HicB family nuclease
MITTALIEKSKDGTYGIFTPDLECTIIGSGSTVEEAKADFEDSARELIQFYKGNRIEMPDELKDVQFVYKYDISSVFDYFNLINVSKFAKRVGINPSLMRQYKTGKAYISEAQIAKIESALHQLGADLAAIKL